MTDKESLLAAVAASPDDDLPRLVLADLLDETGESDRAELIRLMCGDRPTSGACSRRLAPDELPDRRWALPDALDECRRTPYHRLSVFNRYGGQNFWDATWERGFLVAVQAPIALLTDHLPGLVRDEPLLRTVRATDATPAGPVGGAEEQTGWAWFRQGHRRVGPEHGSVPPAVFDRLTGCAEESAGNAVWRQGWRTEAGAHAALGDALLAWAEFQSLSEVTA